MDRPATSFQQPRVTRRLLVGAGLASAGLAVLGAAATVLRAGEEALRAAARTARPSAIGTSSTRCAHCGATDHAMLAGCPLDPLQRAPRLGSAGQPGSPDA